MAQLEESSVTIGTIRGSRYVAPIKVRRLLFLYKMILIIMFAHETFKLR